MDKPLANPPIVEAVVDIDCDLPPKFDLRSIESEATNAFANEYPIFEAKVFQEHQLEQKGDTPPKVSARRASSSLLFLKDDKKQVVQVRTRGFSFNRLAPYSSLDDYLPEIERTWLLYKRVAAPVQVQVVRLRYINEIRLPRTEDGSLNLLTYFDVRPVLRGGEYTFLTIFHQNTAVENATGNEVNVILTNQPPQENELAVILDITVAKAGRSEPDDWTAIRAKIDSLRQLKNRVFENILTEKCLSFFQ